MQRARAGHGDAAGLLFDLDYQPSETRPLAVSGTTLLGVGTTAERALLVFQSAAGIDYEQVCL